MIEKQAFLESVEMTMLTAISEQTNEEQLAESMRYSVEAGGKRIRPLLLASTYALYQKNVSQAVCQVAAAVELVHTYSLIHDDLPAMDNDDLRRGKPTNHKVFGEALAILAGDGLLTLAFQLLGQAELADDKKVACLTLLAQTAGTFGMVAGQAADIEAEGKQLSLEQLQGIHARKTGELIRFSVIAGGIIGGASAKEQAQLDSFARRLGLAFQIKDDLLDVLATTEELGKTAHRDSVLQKSTYPQLLGVQKAKDELTKQVNEARSIVQDFAEKGYQTDALEAMMEKFTL